MTEVLERIAARVPAGEWAAAAAGEAGVAEQRPVLRLTNLSAERLQALFDAFLEETATVGTDVMTTDARALAAGDARKRRAALESALATTPRADGVAFHARALVEAVATTLAARILPSVGREDSDATAECGVCGAPPVVATLRNHPGALGSRGLVCCRCGTEWRARRLTCISCGETSADRLRVHAAESVPHVRIDACDTCRRYIKTVDLRQRGDAVPVVDELASVELDLWAEEQGLTKGRSNLFSL